MKSPSYRKITRSAKKAATAKSKAMKPAKAKKPASKATKALMAIPPAVMGAMFVLDAHYRKGKKYQGRKITDDTTGETKTTRSTQAIFKRKKG